jgi:S-(hydroxymethyl)glutathione dehydrogenase/alcohol dehydrogenase
VESDSPRWIAGGLSEFTAGQITTFSQYSVISENRCTRVPEETPVELRTLLGCSLSTALGTIEQEAQLKIGESVLIIGCGGLGLNLILAAKLRGAANILVVDPMNEKQLLAESMGATNFGHYAYDMDVVIDTSGDPVAIEEGIGCLSRNGRFIMVGQPKEGDRIIIPNARRMFEGNGKHIFATQGGGFQPHRDIPRYCAAHRAGVLETDGLITHRLPLERINDGLDLVRQGQAGRVLILPHDTHTQ